MSRIIKRLTAKPLVIAMALVMIQGCEDDGASEPGSGSADDGSFLAVSHSEMYFGATKLGVRKTDQLVITNQSANNYTIDSITVSGATDYSIEYENVAATLSPGQRIPVSVNYVPSSTGYTIGALEIIHSTEVLAAASKSLLEQKYYKAKELESAQKYDESLGEYKSYIAGAPVTQNKRRANTKVPVLTESAAYGTGDELRLYSAALDDREVENADAALAKLDQLIASNPDSYLVDDAMYMRGYIHMMDTFDYKKATRSMQALRKAHPTSSYYDTALYVEAMAEQELGNDDVARTRYQELRDRHTGISIEMFEVQWPKDTYIAKLWFDRSSQGLESLGS